MLLRLTRFLTATFSVFAVPLAAQVTSTVPLAGTNPRDIVVYDLDGDLDLDIAVANTGTATIDVLVNDGSGGFTLAITFSSGGGAPVSLIGSSRSDGGAAKVASAYQNGQ